jgi:homoserine dehydrogenase
METVVNAQLKAATHYPRIQAAKRLDLILIGARGQVGTALRHQLAAVQSQLKDQHHLDLRLLAAYDRRGFAFELSGLDPLQVEAQLQARSEGDAERLFVQRSHHHELPAIVIDCTASDEIADQYPQWLSSGIGIVTANKRANSRNQAYYELLKRTARNSHTPYRYETTVGAAIPIIGPIQDLVARGEKIHSLQGVLSGSLSYILDRVHQGAAFSDAVLEARAKGYTEPDPFDDLLAKDLVRKLLVLARESGFQLEPEQVSVDAIASPPKHATDDLKTVLREQDPYWAARVQAAKDRSQKWVVLADIERDKARVSLTVVPERSPFALLAPGQNLVRIQTERQQQLPLILSGAGAGPEVTAAGVLSDIIAAAKQFR